MQYSYKMCALLRYYAAYTGNSLPTFRKTLSVSSSSVKKSKKEPGNIWQAVYIEKGVGGDRLSVSLLPPNRVDAGGKEGGKCSSSVLRPR